MKKEFISLMNNQTFYRIWNNLELNHYLKTMINKICNDQDDYKLLETFNKKNIYLRSYIFLESNHKILFIDFNNQKNDIKVKLDVEIITFLKLIYDKEVFLILFNSFDGENKFKDNIYSIYKNKSNDNFINFLLSDNYELQQKYDYKEILEYIYNLDKEFYISYLNEEIKTKNIYILT